MEIAIFIFYFLLCCFVIYKAAFYKRSGLKPFELLSLFTIKVAAGIAYAQFYKLPRNYENSDSWRFYRASLRETKWLLHDPIAFTKDMFTYGYSNTGGLFSGHDSYWNDLKSNIPVKLLAITNVLTNNSYYADIILFNFLFFIGLVALFRLFNAIYQTNKWILIIGIILLPSTLFWCSGIHKDGLLLSATGVLLYCFHKSITGRWRIRYIIVMLVSWLLIFGLRNYIALALLPGLACWALALKYPGKTSWIFIGVYLAGIIMFFAGPHISESLNFPERIVQKQQEFHQLSGESKIDVRELRPTAGSFIDYLPTALDMAFLRPHISEARNLSYLPAAIENLVVLLLMLFSAVALFIRKGKSEALTWFLLFFAGSILLIAGYTIPFSGAIVRYRSYALPFLITPLLIHAYSIMKRNITL